MCWAAGDFVGARGGLEKIVKDFLLRKKMLCCRGLHFKAELFVFRLSLTRSMTAESRSMT